MKRSNVDTSTPTSSSKRTRSDGENEEGPPPPDENIDFLRYENYEQFKELMGKSDFAKKLSHPSNQDIVHRLVTDTRNCSEEDIDERTKVLSEIISNRLALLHNQAYDEWHTPLHQPNVHIKLIKFLVKSGVPMYSVTRSCRFSFVHLVTFYFNPEEFQELVAYLLEKGFDKLMRTGDCNGLTPIHLAVYSMEVKTETILMCRDSEHVQFDLMNDVDVKGNNLLALAVMGGRNEAYLNLLQELGALPKVNFVGYSVLHHAAAYGNLDAIKLFGTGDHLYQEARGGLTPVHVALFVGRRNIHDVVKALVERRKDYAIIPDDGGYTPLSWAQTGPLKEIMEPRTVELLQNELVEFKSVLNQRNSTRARSSAEAETIEGSTAETRRASGQENIAPEFELEIDDVESNNEGGTVVDVASDSQFIGDTGSETVRSNDDNVFQNLVTNSLACRINVKDKNTKMYGEAVRVPLNDHDHSIQDASQKASDACEKTGRTLGPVEAQNCVTEFEGIVPETDIDELDTLDRCDANSNSSTSATSAKDTVHLGVSNSLDSLNEAVQANGNENEIQGASPVPLDDHANQDASSNELDPTGETENTLVPIDARDVSKESEIRDTTPEPLVDVLGGSDASIGVIAGDSTVKESGADLTSRCYWNTENALSLAVKGGRTVKSLQSLLSLGIKPFANQYQTLVQFAARHCSLDMFELVIQLAPTPTDFNSSSWHSVLRYALSEEVMTENHVKITHALLHKYGVKKRLKECEVRDVIHCLVSESTRCSPEEIDKRKQIIDLLTECDDTLLNAKARYEQSTPLASRMVHVDLVKYLIGKGCDPRHRSLGGNTFLHLIEKGQFSAEEYHGLITFLVKSGYADILEMRNTQGDTPLHSALQSIELKEGSIELFKTHEGFFRVTRSQVGNSRRNLILHACCGGRSLNFMKMLMKKFDMGADDIQPHVLHIVAEYGDLEVLKYFLELKPEWVNLKNYCGKTPLHVAVERVGYDRSRLHEAKNLLHDLKVKNVLTQNDIQELIQTCIEHAGFRDKHQLKIMEELTHS